MIKLKFKKQKTGGWWVGIQWWKYGDWEESRTRFTKAKYANVWISLFPGLPAICFTWFNKTAIAIREREQKEKQRKQQ